jgi:hypothetical protein
VTGGSRLWRDSAAGVNGPCWTFAGLPLGTGFARARVTMSRTSSLLLAAVLLSSSACTTLLRMAAGPPQTRAHQPQISLDAQGQAAGIKFSVDLYNENPVELGARHFDYKLECGGQVAMGRVEASGRLPSGAWAPVELYVPIDRTNMVWNAVMAGQPYFVTGTLALAGGLDGLAVGVSGEGVIAASGQPVMNVSVVSTAGGVR